MMKGKKKEGRKDGRRSNVIRKKKLGNVEKKKAEVKKSDDKKSKETPPRIAQNKNKKMEESQLEEDVEDSPKMSTFFQQFPSVKSSPVLERVARVQETNLEQQISGITAKRENEDKRIIRYGGEKSDYEIARPQERNNFHYTETPTTYDFALGGKKKDVVDFNLPKQEWETKERRKTMAEMERAGSEEMRNENKGKKYLTNRKY